MNIRPVTEEDWEAYRRVRLASLSAHPELFCPSQDESRFSAEQWRARLRNPDAAHFGLFDGQQQLVGIASIVKKEAGRAYLVGSYIDSKCRGQGVSYGMMEARIRWARSRQDVHTVVVEHREDNGPVLAVHQRLGFQFESGRVQQWSDGKTLECRVYTLEV